MVKLVRRPQAECHSKPRINWRGVGCLSLACLVGIIVGVSFVLFGTSRIQAEQSEVQNICKPEININFDLGELVRSAQTSQATTSNWTRSYTKNDTNPK